MSRFYDSDVKLHTSAKSSETLPVGPKRKAKGKKKIKVPCLDYMTGAVIAFVPWRLVWELVKYIFTKTRATGVAF